MSFHTYQYTSDSGSDFNMILSQDDANAQPGGAATAAISKGEGFLRANAHVRSKGIVPRHVTLHLGSKNKKLIILTDANFATAITSATLNYKAVAWTVTGYRNEGFNGLA